MLKEKRWPPYLVGTGIGLLGLATIVLMHETLGASSAFERFSAALYALLFPGFYKATGFQVDSGPIINWYCYFVIGILIGGWLSAKLSGFTPQRIPSVWQDNFGPSFFKRAIGAFIGGFILMMGARIARGCTSGHAISGGMHLATAGWLFMIAIFASGILTAHILYRKGR